MVGYLTLKRHLSAFYLRDAKTVQQVFIAGVFNPINFETSQQDRIQTKCMLKS